MAITATCCRMFMKLTTDMKRGLRKEKMTQSITRERRMPPYCLNALTKAAWAAVCWVMIENLLRAP
ncbi:hypothetical protein D3C80_2193680 [compost metagenome]